jgi:hypothetical protein
MAQNGYILAELFRLNDCCRPSVLDRLLAEGVAVDIEELQGIKGEREMKERGKEREKE